MAESPQSLTQAEKRLLAVLPKDGTAMGAAEAARRAGWKAEVEALQAAGSPVRAGLVELTESATTAHALTAEGQRIHALGLPEERAARALAAGPLALPELAVAAHLSEAEARVVVGLLKKLGWADVAKGPTGPVLAAKGPGADATHGYPPGALLAALSAIPSPIPATPALAGLVERGLAAAVAQRSRTLRLTPAGQAAAAGLDAEAIAGVVEVGQVTPELIARWASMGRDERAKHHLRPFDTALAVSPQYPGKPHPLSQMLAEIRGVFWRMGFAEISGDYVESAHWNMDALFIPQDHPARDMQDTFYLAEPAVAPVAKPDLDRTQAIHQSGGGTGSTGWGGAFDRDVAQRALLRTHTTNTTVRYLADNFLHGGPTATRPHKVFGLGRVFRKETMDATHLPEFTQIEGIVVEPGATFNTLVGLCRHFFAAMGFPEVRFRPAYFPYTEPSMEIEVHYNGRWMELGGCGLFRPEVTKPLNVPHNVLAWGFGLERLAMMRLGLKDIRDLYVSDVQWLRETPLQET